MNKKPDFLSFVWNNVMWIKKYFIYYNRSTGKMYKELNAYRNRKIMLFVLCVVPFINLLLFEILFSKGEWNDWLLNLDFLYVIVCYVMFILRYKKVQFVEINKREDAEDTKIRVLEIFLVILFLSNFFFVRGHIFIEPLLR